MRVRASIPPCQQLGCIDYGNKEQALLVNNNSFGRLNTEDGDREYYLTPVEKCPKCPALQSKHQSLLTVTSLPS